MAEDLRSTRMTILLDAQLVLLIFGALIGGQLVLAVLSVLVGSAYHERSLFVHSAAIAVSVASIVLMRSGNLPLANAALVLLLALSVLHLRELTLHVGALHGRKRVMTLAALALAALACASPLLPVPMLAPGMALAGWLAWLVYALIRAWAQSRPWITWAAAGWAGLTVACLVRIAGLAGADSLATPIALAFWSMGIYLASVWRSRVFGERRSRAEGEHLFDPLTGLVRRAALVQRLDTARELMRRFQYPATFVLVHLDDAARIGAHAGAEAAENAVLEAGARIRRTLGQADVAARVGPHRFAILSEGTSAAEASAGVATRILSAGLREPLRAVPDVYVRFRIVLGELPLDDTPFDTLLERVAQRLDEDVARNRERRIRAVDIDALLPASSGGASSVVPLAVR
jgi:diguanylate cyclase (GGDEF)-like protein